MAPPENSRVLRFTGHAYFRQRLVPVSYTHLTLPTKA